MSPKPGSPSKELAGSYLMLWKYEGNERKIIHIDMASGS
jgi:hypothetical protein